MESKRKCSTCKEPKPLTPEFFHRRSNRKSGFQSNCIECSHKRARKWERDNAERKREATKLRRNGVSVLAERRAEREQYEREIDMVA